MPVDLDSLLAAIDMVQTAPDRWTAPHLDPGLPRVFGGQLLAQAVMVAAATAGGEEKEVKSLSCRFPREGRSELPLELAVERLHDGRTFATRRIGAIQEGRVVCLADVTLHVPEEGLHHQSLDASGRAYSSSATDTRVQRRSFGPEEAVPVELGMIPWETRVVDGVDLTDPRPGPASFAFWNRVDEGLLPDRPAVHQALLAHATDLTLIGTALRPHAGYSQADAHDRLATAVTSHSIWFHQPFRLDQWCLVTQDCPITTGGRGFGLGHVVDITGRLLATFAQESLIRVGGLSGSGRTASSGRG